MNKTALDAALIKREKERRALSMTTPGAAKPRHDRYLLANDESRPAFNPENRSLHRYQMNAPVRRNFNNQYAGPIEFRRTEADRRPPRSVVTELAYPNPEPGRPFPGASVEAIIAWNLQKIAQNEQPIK